MKHALYVWLAALGLTLGAASADAATITIGWDRNPESNIAGYVVSYGTATGAYSQTVDVGQATTWTLTVSDGRTYYFAVQAYNTVGQRSGYSNEAAGAAPITSSPSPSPAPSPSGSVPRMAIDAPAPNSSVQGGFIVAGWATDLAASSGSGVDAVHVWAAPNPGSGAPSVFIGAATVGISRPDVGAALNSPRGSSAGYGLITSDLAPGPYDVTVFAHSTVTGTFNNAQVIRVNVVARGSRPMMVVDIPGPNTTTSGLFQIGGWAIDLAAGSGSGVDAVHAWAYPAGGGAPLWVGACIVNQQRPDVGGVFGAQFRTGGYTLAGQLPPGSYNLVLFAHSAVANAFNNTITVPITVR
jgi:hypothetical protein